MRSNNKLERKFNQRIAWWSRKRWCDVVTIPSESSNVSLLTCDVKFLSNVKLFNLTLRQLEDNIQAYRNKPIWRRWLQRCFSSINQQIKAKKYYQACLEAREIKSLPEKNSSYPISTVAEQSSDVQPLAATSIPVLALSKTKSNTGRNVTEDLSSLNHLVNKYNEDIKKIIEIGKEIKKENDEKLETQQRMLERTCEMEKQLSDKVINYSFDSKRMPLYFQETDGPRKDESTRPAMRL